MAGGKGGNEIVAALARYAPKQFIQFVGDRTLFQATLARVSDETLYAPAVIITNEDFRFLAREQARELGVPLSAILLEPMARNTAPAVAVAAAFVADRMETTPSFKSSLRSRDRIRRALRRCDPHRA